MGQNTASGAKRDRPLNEVQPALRNVAQRKEGQVSDVLELDGQFVLIKCSLQSTSLRGCYSPSAGKLPQATKSYSRVATEEDNVQAYLKSVCSSSAKR
jgi:hypothetical protein